MIYTTTLNRFAFLLVLVLSFWNCDKEDDPLSPGEIRLEPLASSFEGVRGTEVIVSFVAEAQDGIASLVIASPDGTRESIAVPADETKFTAEITVRIPGDALLGMTYPVEIELTDDDGDQLDLQVEVKTIAMIPTPPSTYSFERNGISSVSYSGQNERLDMVEEIKAYLRLGDAGAALSAQVLNDAYNNTNGNGNGFFSFMSVKDLRSKSFAPDLDEQFMEDLFAAAETASRSGAEASEGTAGLLTRENSGQTILVDANGRELTQLIEKGLMGTVMYNQIFNTYFSDARTGDDVENTDLKEDANYTEMEHHWDEAFGYWNPPLDFTSDWPEERESEDRFWSHYSNVVDPLLSSNDRIMKGFIAGRTAIVNNDLVTKSEKRSEIITALDEVAAATAVHYINSTLTALNEGLIGEAFHTLSEAWAFTNSLKYNPNRKLSLDQIEKIKEVDFGDGGNFWNTTTVGLREAKATIVEAYPDLQSVQDDL